MEVILKENYPSLGYVGERVEVKRGYARNYLIPRGIAVEAASGNAKVLKHRIEMIQRKQKRLLKEAQAVADGMTGLILEFKLLMGSHGKSFGSVTIKDVQASLAGKGIEVDRKQIKLVEPIRAAGEFPLEVKLHLECSAKITLRVLAEKQEPQKPQEKVAKRVEVEDYDEAFEE